MQYSASHVAITALLLSQNGLRSNLRASNLEKFPKGQWSQTALILHALLNAGHLSNPSSDNPGYGPKIHYPSMAFPVVSVHNNTQEWKTGLLLPFIIPQREGNNREVLHGNEANPNTYLYIIVLQYVLM